MNAKRRPLIAGNWKMHRAERSEAEGRENLGSSRAEPSNVTDAGARGAR